MRAVFHGGGVVWRPCIGSHALDPFAARCWQSFPRDRRTRRVAARAVSRASVARGGDATRGAQSTFDGSLPLSRFLLVRRVHTARAAFSSTTRCLVIARLVDASRCGLLPPLPQGPVHYIPDLGLYFKLYPTV